ncbi:FAD-binding protein, partial [uncultured Adlercreutzia sp.]|uniref:FAD-binding protein n=1 Tax=uncultured Adlercreutzia sp. TaxID=875803 RepID=UPI0025A67136
MTIMGGLRTSADMEVCDEDDEPIPGLFNVGCMVGDMYANELPHPPRRPRFLMPPPLVVRDHPLR